MCSVFDQIRSYSVYPSVLRMRALVLIGFSLSPTFPAARRTAIEFATDCITRLRCAPKPARKLCGNVCVHVLVVGWMMYERSNCPAAETRVSISYSSRARIAAHNCGRRHVCVNPPYSVQLQNHRPEQHFQLSGF